jgi:hypothetical protein
MKKLETTTSMTKAAPMAMPIIKAELFSISSISSASGPSKEKREWPASDVFSWSGKEEPAALFFCFLEFREKSPISCSF